MPSETLELRTRTTLICAVDRKTKVVSMGRRDKAPAVVAVEQPEEEEEEEEAEEAEEMSSAPESTEESEEEPAETTPAKKKAKKGKPTKEPEPESGDEGAAKKRKKKQRRHNEANHPPTTEMVLEALMALDERKGTTIKAIKDYIMSENTVRPEHISHLMRKALPKLLAKEAIFRPKGEENKSLMMGRYKVAPRKAEPGVRERPASLRRLADPNATKKKKKKRKGFY
ncbi:Linker histone H1/H5 domain H15 [Trinorchestia longiramus]|nr:Linker histone H1/H5 domain H15 [Trinorchestia longiramus]